MNEQSTQLNQPARMERSNPLPGLIYFMILVVVTHAAALLMNQPAAYWLDSDYASNLPFSFLLRAGPILYLIIVLFYLSLIWLLLSRLSSATTLALSAGLLLIHLVGLSNVTKCGFYPIYEAHDATSCHTFRYVPLILECIMLILVLVVGRLPQQFITWGKRTLAALAIAWLFLMGYGIYRAALPPDSAWHALAPAHSPGPRSMSAVAYDLKRNRAVLFGGITRWNGKEWVYDTSTWEWDGKDWSEVKTSVTPAGRILHAMAYDEKRGTVVLYGGQNASGNLADLWEWDGTSWHRLCPVCNPAARFSHRMIYDANQEKIVLYGGQDGKVGLAEAWTWDGTSWTYFQFRESSPATYNAPLIYDTAGQRAISFMGRDWGGTWVWQSDLWQKPKFRVQPPGRDEATLVYDPVRDATILFGGTNEDQYLYNDTWMLHQDTWTRLDTPGFPPQRSKAVAFYDPIRDSMILYGGEMYGSIYGDMWELTLARGEQ